MGWVGRLQLRSVGRSTMIGPDTEDGALSDRIAHTLFTKIGWTEVGGGKWCGLWISLGLKAGKEAESKR